MHRKSIGIFSVRKKQMVNMAHKRIVGKNIKHIDIDDGVMRIHFMDDTVSDFKVRSLD